MLDFIIKDLEKENKEWKGNYSCETYRRNKKKESKHLTTTVL